MENNKPNEVENKVLEELFIAIYFSDLKKVMEFKKYYPEIYSKKNNFLINGIKSFNLINLTFFNYVLWKDNWTEKIMPMVKKNRQRTEEMIDYWKKELNLKIFEKNIEYNQYHEYFFCTDPNDPKENNKVIIDTLEYFLVKGIREIDLRLYISVVCFDFNETRKLLELGANPNIKFYEDEWDSTTFGHIGGECSYLATCEVIPTFEYFDKNGEAPTYYNSSNLFGNFIGLTAFEEMYELLLQYTKEEKIEIT
jgi:hypothetical protein